MTAVMSWPSIPNPRKHRRAHDEVRPAKRPRLDQLLQGLSISEPPGVDQHHQAPHDDFTFEVNPQAGASYAARKDELNTLIADQMMHTFTQLYQQQHQVIRYQHPTFVLVHRFQRWVLRLFNRFVRRYNAENGTKVRYFKTFQRIVDLVEAENFTFTHQQLLHIVLQENELEQSQLRAKQARKTASAPSVEELDLDPATIKYNYWDTLPLDSDFEMLEASDQCSDIAFDE